MSPTGTATRGPSRYIVPMKQRLYDFPRRKYWEQWERVNLEEHRKFSHCIEIGGCAGATAIIQDKHWGRQVPQPYFAKFQQLETSEPATSRTKEPRICPKPE